MEMFKFVNFTTTTNEYTEYNRKTKKIVYTFISMLSVVKKRTLTELLQPEWSLRCYRKHLAGDLFLQHVSEIHDSSLVCAGDEGFDTFST